jgi:NAD(P)H-dependent flavin oxidoreductase YrpB (nitropropane dioxygenase family)
MVPSAVEPASGACGVNFLLPFRPSLDDVRAAAGKSRVVEFFYDDPQAEMIQAAHDGGALAAWQVGSVAEAAAAAELGCDFVVAQGVEAGGHVRGTQALNDLLPAVLRAVEIPVVAAGGVATAERFAALIDIGADGVRVGTRFVVCPEAGAHPDYVQALLAAGDDDTELTEWFGEGWEQAPHRVLCSALDAARRSEWRTPLPPHRDVDRGAGDMAMYAGTAVGRITAAEPAAAVVADLTRLI